MKFPNAYEGVKKICKAILFLIISCFLSMVAGITDLIGDGAVIVGVIAVIAACVLMIIAFILKILGVNRASKDEQAFKTAFTVLIVGIAANILVSVFNSNDLIGAIGNFIIHLAEILACYYICTGIVNCADALGDKAVSAEGLKTRKNLMCIWGIAAVFSIISIIFFKNKVVYNIFNIAGSCISLLAYIIYYGLLKKATAMLEQ